MNTALLVLILSLTQAQVEEPNQSASLLEAIFDSKPKRYDKVIDAAEARRVQVLVTQIGTREDPRALVRHSFRVGAEYLYPASALKPAAAIAAILRAERARDKDSPPLRLKDPLRLTPLLEGDEARTTSLAAAIRKTLIVSSNRAYNALYEVAGQERLNRYMWQAGLKDVRLSHRLSRVLSIEDNRRSAAWSIGQGKHKISAPVELSTLDLTNRISQKMQVGQRYIKAGKLVEEPLDFSQKNHMGIRSLQDMLILLVRPELKHGLIPFPLREGHREALVDALTTLPHESAWPTWSRATYDPYRFKPFLRGLERVQALNTLRVVSKAGKAYGFRVDNAYIEDRATGRAFLLTAGLHVDMDGTLNDDRYDYELADEFLANLVEDVARRLLQRAQRP